MIYNLFSVFEIQNGGCFKEHGKWDFLLSEFVKKWKKILSKQFYELLKILLTFFLS